MCYERVRRRRQVGDEFITLEYLQELHLLHEKWLLNKEGVIVIDGMTPIEDNKDILELWEKKGGEN